MATTAGSRATRSDEPRQVRKEATVSQCSRVPRGHLVRADGGDPAWGLVGDEGCTAERKLREKGEGRRERQNRLRSSFVLQAVNESVKHADDVTVGTCQSLIILRRQVADSSRELQQGLDLRNRTPRHVTCMDVLSARPSCVALCYVGWDTHHSAPQLRGPELLATRAAFQMEPSQSEETSDFNRGPLLHDVTVSCTNPRRLFSAPPLSPPCYLGTSTLSLCGGQ